MERGRARQCRERADEGIFTRNPLAQNGFLLYNSSE